MERLDDGGKKEGDAVEGTNNLKFPLNISTVKEMERERPSKMNSMTEDLHSSKRKC